MAIKSALAFAKGLPREVWYALAVAAAIWFVWHSGVNRGKEQMRAKLEAERAAHAVTRQSVATLESEIERIRREAEARQREYLERKQQAEREARRLAQEAASSAKRIERLKAIAARSNGSCEADRAILDELEGL